MVSNIRRHLFTARIIGILTIVIGFVCVLAGLALFGALLSSGMLPIISIEGLLLYLVLAIIGVALSIVGYKVLKQKLWAFKTLRALLIIISAGAGILLIYQFITIFQSGLEETEIVKAWLLIVLFISAYWGAFQLTSRSTESIALFRFKKLIMYGGIVSLLLLLIPLGLSFVCKDNWLFIRGNIAEKTGSTECALSLYTKTIMETNSQTIKDKSKEAISKLQFSTAIKHYYMGEINQAVEILLALAQSPFDLDRDTREQLPEKLYTCAMELRDKKQWDLSRSLMVSLVTNYPTHRLAEKAGELQKWYFDSIISAETKAHIPVPVYQLTSKGLKKIREENYSPREGLTLLFLAVRIAHIGRTPKELQAANFALISAENKTIECVGFKTQYGTEKAWKEKNVTIGPDAIETTLLFEIPKNLHQFKLEMFNTGVTKFDLKGS